MNASDYLTNANMLLANRGMEYDKGEEERSMEKVVATFNAATGKNLTESEGWLFMIFLKSVRLFNKPGFHRDSAEDLIGYAALLAESKEKEK